MNSKSNIHTFNNAPLEEVVLGVQFADIVGYNQIDSKDVQNLYFKDFPVLSTNAPLPSTFETFGPPQNQEPQIKFNSAPPHPRYVFSNNNGEMLLQFQNDKFLQNWRVNGSGSSYPRFDSNIKHFLNKTNLLESYFESKFNQKITINQCEIHYSNRVTLTSEMPLLSDWFNFISLPETTQNTMGLNFSSDFYIGSVRFGRLTIELMSQILVDNPDQISWQFKLTVRGNPVETNIASAIDFLSKGRETIVKEFYNLTTKKAHEYWEKI